jgi:hypothetical protein
MLTEAPIEVPIDFELWMHRAGNGNWDALAALLLCLLPNLEELILTEYNFDLGYPYVEAVLHRAAKLQNGLPISPDKLYQFSEDEYIFKKAMSTWLQAATRKNPHLQFGLTKLRQVSLSGDDADNFPRIGLEVHTTLPYIALKSGKKFSGHLMMGGFSFLPQIMGLLPRSYTAPLPVLGF